MMSEFKSKRQARRVAVDNPMNVGALAGSYWPPYSRAELMRVPVVLRRIAALGMSIKALPPYTLSPKFLVWRLQELAKVFNERAVRHRSQTSSNRLPTGERTLSTAFWSHAPASQLAATATGSAPPTTKPK